MKLTIFKCPLCGYERRNLPDFEKYDESETVERICTSCKDSISFVTRNRKELERVAAKQRDEEERRSWEGTTFS